MAGQHKFHAEADWKTIAELIPIEVPAIERKRTRKKDQDQDKKNTSMAVIQGPKPGKPTDLSRMRQMLIKLKHLEPSPPPAPPLVATIAAVAVA